MTEASQSDALPYGADEWTRRATEELTAAFGASDALFVFNGTAANVLGVSLLLKPYEAVICAESSHLNVDECGATERILGNKLLHGRDRRRQAHPRVGEVTADRPG